ncbi:MAG: hypothetical protein FGM46_10390, partial [Ferruginibacter sp.]|nr:hypothetical protein [Ferruginibacter sp.]
MSLLHEIKVPLLSVNDTSLTVVSTPFKTGQKVMKGDVLIVFETSKTTYDAVAEQEGFVQYLCTEGEDYNVSDIAVKIFSSAEEISEDKRLAQPEKKQDIELPIANKWTGETIFSNAALQLMKSLGFDKSIFAEKDFVCKADVEKKAGIDKQNRKDSSKIEVADIISDEDDVSVVKISSNKKREVQYLSAVQSTGLTSTVHTYIETDGLLSVLDKKLKLLKGSLLPIVIYEVSRLLNEFKELNAFFSDDKIAYYNKVNTGFAVDLGKGLKVLKIADADSKTITEIEDEIISLSDKYISEKLTIDDLTDIGFTIT